MCKDLNVITAYDREIGEKSIGDSMLTDTTNKGIEQVVKKCWIKIMM